jgi:hypothetical protein
MFNRRILPALFTVVALVGLAHSEDRVQSELKFVGHNKAEKTAGVWVDGQYVGFVKELSGDKKITLLPGKHDVVVRQAWYNDYTEQVILEPGQTSVVKVSLVRAAHPQAQAATGELKIDATPTRQQSSSTINLPATSTSSPAREKPCFSHRDVIAFASPCPAICLSTRWLIRVLTRS